MDLSKLCRGCMKEVASWEKENFDTRAVEMFCFCTNIRITDDDKLPKQFCYDCVIKIESSYTFITEAQKVNVTLKNIVSRNNTSVIVQTKSNADIKLTLPEYKICSVIENDKQIVNKTIETIDSAINNEVTEQVELKESVNKESKEIVCDKCKKSFTSKTWFNKHMKNVHEGVQFACQHCPKSYPRRSQLMDHQLSHSEERRFACEACGARFKRRKQLGVHARAHSQDRPYACDHCSARFKTKSILKSHLAIHAKDKPFLCSYCGWSFTQAGNLKAHTLLHSGEKPFRCEWCSFRCTARSALARHARAHRPAARPTHTCTHCHKGFHDASNLRRHIRSHTGELRHACAECGARFADSWKRNQHLLRVHHLPPPARVRPGSYHA